MSGSPVADLLHEPSTRCAVLRLQPELVSVTLARHWVTEVLGCWQLPVEVVRSCALVTSELAANAVVHARTPFELGLGTRDGILLGSVGDGSTEPPVSPEPDATAVGGRGLRIVHALTDDVSVTTCDTGKVVHFCIVLPTP